MGRALQAYKRLFDELKTKEPRPVYFLYGPEEYIKKEFVNELIRRVIGDRDRPFNLDILHGDDFDRDRFDDRIASFPLFADRRVVILKRFEALSLAHKDAVIDRLSATPASLTVVIETSADKLDNARLKKIDAIAKAQGVSFRFQNLDDSETVTRIRSRLQREGLSIEPEALDLLIASVGTGLSDLVNELDKIVLAIDGDTVVRSDSIRAVVGQYRTDNIFTLLDGLGSRDISKAISRVNRLIDAGEEPVLIVALLMRRVLQLLHVKALQADEPGRGRSAAAVAAELGGSVSPFLASRLLAQLDRFDSDRLLVHVNNLRWVDRQLKSSSVSPRSLIETGLIASSLGKTLAHGAGYVI